MIKPVFLHIPKCAGSTITDYILSELKLKHGKGCELIHDHYSNREILMKKASETNFVTGHFSYTTYLEFCGNDDFSFTFLREPRERLKSLYFFIANAPLNVPWRKDMNGMCEMSAAEFLGSDRNDVLYQTKNFMTRQFSEDLYKQAHGHIIRDGSVEIAIENLSKLDCVGFSDCIESGYLKICQGLGLNSPDGALEKSNVTSDLYDDDYDYSRESELFDEAFSEFGEPLICVDRELYARASELWAPSSKP